MATSNFKNFAKFDLTINKKFYTNMIIMAICVGIGVCALCFLGRWMVYNSAVKVAEAVGSTVPVYTTAHFSNHTITTMFMCLLYSSLPAIFAGCTFHSLRKKQGRITELTLPATNKQKYLWHVLVSIVGGGIILTTVTMLCADLTNYIAHLIAFGTDYSYSLTADFFNTMTLNLDEFKAVSPMMLPEEANIALSILTAIRWLIITTSIFNLCAYIYGNSVKYHYNIIITYAILLGISIVGAFGFFGLFGLTHADTFIHHQGEISQQEISAHNIATGNDLITWIYCVIAIFVIASVLCIWRSIKRYNNAQVTSISNK